jgi:hypothetical protein
LEKVNNIHPVTEPPLWIGTNPGNLRARKWRGDTGGIEKDRGKEK